MASHLGFSTACIVDAAHWTSWICQIVPPTPTASTSRSVAKLGETTSATIPPPSYPSDQELEGAATVSRDVRAGVRTSVDGPAGRRAWRRCQAARPAPSPSRPPRRGRPSARPAGAGRPGAPRSRRPASATIRADRRRRSRCRSGRRAASGGWTAGSGSCAARLLQPDGPASAAIRRAPESRRGLAVGARLDAARDQRSVLPERR